MKKLNVSYEPQRCYVFAHAFLSSFQKAHQAGHCAVWIGSTFRNSSIAKNRRISEKYDTWAEVDQTLIVLDGGTSERMEFLNSQLEQWGHKLSLPYGHFNESMMCDIMTATGIIVPSKLLHTQRTIVETDLANLLNGSRLAI